MNKYDWALITGLLIFTAIICSIMIFAGYQILTSSPEPNKITTEECLNLRGAG